MSPQTDRFELELFFRLLFNIDSITTLLLSEWQGRFILLVDEFLDYFVAYAPESVTNLEFTLIIQKVLMRRQPIILNRVSERRLDSVLTRSVTWVLKNVSTHSLFFPCCVGLLWRCHNRSTTEIDQELYR